MQNYLYQDLYNLEDKHFWHLGKRELAKMLICKFVNNGSCASHVKKYSKIATPNSDWARNDNDIQIKILDIGCGAGKNLEMLESIGKAHGIDISPEAIKFCQMRKLKNVKLGESESTGFDNHSFDLVTMFDVLEHTDEEKTLNEVNRILKPQGYLLLTVPAYQFLWSRWDEVLKHKKRYVKSETEKILDGYRFKTIKSSYFFSYLLVPVMITRWTKKLFNKKDYGSDFSINNSFINFIAKLLNNIERLIISYSSLPFGTSIIVIAKKK